MKTKDNIFSEAFEMLQQLNFKVIGQDCNRPWGGFYVIDEAQADAFTKHFFPEEVLEALKIANKLSPKILIVAPGKRLSWQYHNRRAEIWRCIKGKVAVATSFTDVVDEKYILQTGDKIKLQQQERHRLIGLQDWGIVAEIWQHTDALYTSNEEDIVRLQDDFGR